MTQKDRELLLKDLCARLPYGVKCQFEDTIETIKEIWFCEDEGWQVDGDKTSTCIHAVKPYLFPLSSMTEEQKKEYNRRKHDIQLVNDWGCVVEKGELFDSPESFEYLIENHFDYYGLIPMGLAIDSTNLNVY